jgi:hypothetical protein
MDWTTARVVVWLGSLSLACATGCEAAEECSELHAVSFTVTTCRAAGQSVALVGSGACAGATFECRDDACEEWWVTAHRPGNCGVSVEIGPRTYEHEISLVETLDCARPPQPRDGTTTVAIPESCAEL